MRIGSIRDLYGRRAKHYEVAVKLYQASFGFRYTKYQSLALDLLHLKAGDIVVDLGCGTGLNFSSILSRIGPTGQLIGLDLTEEMLARAHERTARYGWQNVDLIESDMTEFRYPGHVDAVCSTGALGFVEEFDDVIKAAYDALRPGGRLAIWDLKSPDRWPPWLVTLLFKSVARPYGVTPAYFAGRPWESVERYFSNTTFEQRYWGLVYITSGIALD